MTKEQELLIELLAHSISGSEIEFNTENIDWQALVDESVAQTVCLVAFDCAISLKNKIPEHIYTQWFNHAYRFIAVNYLVEKSQKELTQILLKGDFPYVILKGLSSASFYEKSELRMLGDVDFLIQNDEKQQIKEILIKDGYKVSHENHICHIVFTKPKAHLEMHFEISGIPNGENGDIIREYMKDAIENAVEKTHAEQSFFAPTDYHHAVILLLHMQHHILGEGIGLRQLMDWACFVHKTYDMPFWDEKVIPILQKVGLFEFANVFTALCVKFFKINAPSWITPREDQLLNELLEDIFSAGNFGKKDKKRTGSGMMISNRGKDGTQKGKIYYLNKTLVNSSFELYPITKKYKILLPFVNFYRVLRYIFLRCIGKRPSLIGAISLAEKRKALYRSLHIFEVNGNE